MTQVKVILKRLKMKTWSRFPKKKAQWNLWPPLTAGPKQEPNKRRCRRVVLQLIACSGLSLLALLEAAAGASVHGKPFHLSRRALRLGGENRLQAAHSLLHSTRFHSFLPVIFFPRSPDKYSDAIAAVCLGSENPPLPSLVPSSSYARESEPAIVKLVV